MVISKKSNTGRSSRRNRPLLEQIRELADNVIREDCVRRGLLKVGATEEEFDRVKARRSFGFGHNSYYGAPDEVIRRHYEKHGLLKVGATKKEFDRVKVSEIRRVGYGDYYKR